MKLINIIRKVFPCLVKVEYTPNLKLLKSEKIDSDDFSCHFNKSGTKMYLLHNKRMYTYSLGDYPNHINTTKLKWK